VKNICDRYSRQVRFNYWRVDIMKRLINLGLTVLVASTIGLVITSNAKAEGEISDVTTNVAADGDSLTTIVRSRVADQATNQKVTLSNEAKTYAETTIVQTTGPRELSVGESVTLKKSLLNDTVTSASKLSPEELAAWKPYADQIDFAGNSLVAGVSKATDLPDKPSDSTGKFGPDDALNPANAVAAAKSSSWYWWPLGLITLGGLYYILGGKPSKETE
jgi:hypothetical protein